MNREEDRVVFRRGMIEHGWTPSGYRPPIVHTAEPEERAPRRSFASRAVPYAAVATFTLIIILALTALSFRAYETQGSSMEPDLHDGDGVLVARIVYEEVDFGLFDWLPFYSSSSVRWGSPSRGDVIVFESPVRNESLVKRVIGLPGDIVRVRDGAVYVNGEKLDEPYIQGITDCLRACGDVEVPKDHYFVLGDNREKSVDSRQGWTVSREEITGKVILAY